MTIEEKAKRFDEALKEAAIAHKDEDRHLKATLERIFPELKESEDEKIRKHIVTFIMEAEKMGDAPEECAKWLAWLEKQGQVKESQISQHENKMCKENDDSLTSEDEKIRKEIKKDAEAWYKEHYEGSNPQGRSIVIGAYIDGALAWLEKQGEKKPAKWSERDERAIHCLEYTVKHFYEGEDTFKWWCDWFKSLKDRVQQQPKQVWKPSDEQMKALQYIYRNINPPLSDKLGWNSLRTLELMYQELKKLRER